MSDKQFPNLILTHTKVLISEWPTIAELICKHSALLKEGGYTPHAEREPMSVLSDRQIEDALNGPYGAFFKNKLQAYAQIARFRLALNIEDDDNLKDNRTSTIDTLKLSKDDLKQISKESLNELFKELNDLVEDQNQMLEGNLMQWQFNVIGELRNTDLQLSEDEAEEFSAPEPLSELMSRFVDLNIPLPKHSGIMNFSEYLKFKADLLILSALSRQHRPNQQKDIDIYLKKIKKTLSIIHKLENKLQSEQEDELNELMRPITKLLKE